MEDEIVSNVAPTVSVSETVQPVSAVAEIATVQSTPVVNEASETTSQASNESPVPKEEEERTHSPSLLSEATSKEAAPDATVTENPTQEEKPEEAASDEVKKPEPSAPIVYEEFKIPEGVSVDKNGVEEFTKTIGEFGVPQEAAQKLLDMHIRNTEAITKQSIATQWDVFNNQQAEWINQVKSDPVLGGAGHETAMNKVAQARDTVFKHNPEKIQLFNDIMSVTGAGNHPIVLEFMHEVHKYTRPGEILNTQIKPPPDIGGRPLTKAERMYGKRG
jgi:hypothetical protein